MIAVSPAMARWLRISAAAAAASLLWVPTWCAAAPEERELHVTLNITAQQSWTKGLQHTQTQSTQLYDLLTHLRTDGRKWGANLLDLNTQKRLAIKTEWMRRNGLEELKRRNGGKVDIPTTEAQKEKMQNELQEEMEKCNGDADCMTGVVQRYSALLSAGDTGAHYGYDGGALLDQPAHFQFFLAFPGCPSRVHLVINTLAEGQKAYDREGKNLVAFKETRKADYHGDASDQQALCNRYNTTIDTAVPDMYLDNLYVPQPRGVTERTLNKTTTSEVEDELLIMEAVEWASQTLRHAKESGTLTKTMHLQWPMDANSTVGGDFDGVAKVTLTWSFLPVPATPPPSPH